MKPYKIIQGDNRLTISTLKPKSVQTIITSPPYWGLRDYNGEEKQIGREPTVKEFISTMVDEVFAPLFDVLRDDGTLWLNMGDGYSDGSDGLPAKSLQGVPWRLAFALQDWGWLLRQEIIWNKPNAMVESVNDRCSKSHEHIFLLTKGPKYFFDKHAIRELTGNESTPEEYAAALAAAGPAWYQRDANPFETGKKSGNKQSVTHPDGKGKRTVWNVPTHSYKGAHFATFPPKLIIPCIKAGTSEKGCCAVCGTPFQRVVDSNRVATRPGKNTKCDYSELKAKNKELSYGNRDPQRHISIVKTTGWAPGCACGDINKGKPCVVLDPFHGSGTTMAAAVRLNRRAIGLELNAEYIELRLTRVEKSLERKGFGLT